MIMGLCSETSQSSIESAIHFFYDATTEQPVFRTEQNTVTAGNKVSSSIVLYSVNGDVLHSHNLRLYSK